MKITNHIIIFIISVLAALPLASCDGLDGRSAGSVRVRVSGVLGTRGAVVSTENITDFGAFTMDGYLGSENRYDGRSDGRVYDEADRYDFHFVKDGAVTWRNGKWTLGGENYWRSGVPTSFWSYFPARGAALAGTRVVTLPADDADDARQHAMTMTYALPPSDLHTDAFRGDDLLVAFSRATWTDGADGYVDVSFRHALCAVRFSVAGVTGVTVANIALKNVVSSGTCTVEADEDDVPRISWDSYGALSVYGQDVEAADFSSGVLAESSGKYFLMIPQDLDSGAQVEVTFDRGDGTTFSRRASIATYNGASVKWEAGKIYSYGIVQDGDGTLTLTISGITVSPWGGSAEIITDC